MENEKNVKQFNPLSILKICGTVLFYLIILLIFLVSIANIRAGKEEDGMPNIFGRGYLNVASTSMEGSQSDSFKQNDMIVVKNLSESKRSDAMQNLKVGDIITFYDKSLSSTKKLNTHRIVLINKDSNGVIQTVYTMGDKYSENTMKTLYYNGEYSLTKFEETFGDLTKLSNTQTIDQLLSGGNLQEVSASNIRGLYIKTISGGGKAEGLIKQYGIIVVFFLFAFLVFEIYMFSRNVIAYKKAKYEETHADEIQQQKDEERRKLKEELMKELLEEEKKKEENKDSNQE